MDEPVHFVLMVKPCVNTRPMERKMLFHIKLEFGQMSWSFVLVMMVAPRVGRNEVILDLKEM